MAIGNVTGLSTYINQFDKSAYLVKNAAEKANINKLADSMVQMAVSEKMIKAEIKQIQSKDEMLGYILDIRK